MTWRLKSAVGLAVGTTSFLYYGAALRAKAVEILAVNIFVQKIP
jgi:hypothetical protein